MKDYPNSLLGLMLAIKSEMDCYLVGGCVRDKLLGIEPNDYDIVVSGDIEELCQYLKDNGVKCDIVGDSFKILAVHMIDKQDVSEEFLCSTIEYKKDVSTIYQIAPFRGKTIEDDCMSRDFTINSLYLEPFSELVIDPCGRGIEDINSRTLRFVGNGNHRIDEDEIRILRAYRFIGNGFKPTPELLRTIRTRFQDVIENSSPSRIMLEIEKIVGIKS